MLRVVAVAVAVAVLFAAPVSSSCFWIDHVDTDPTYFCTYAQYYTVLSAEPDWCDYSYGDWVFLRHQVVGGVLTTTGWYIVPSSDGTSHPSSSFNQYAEDAVGDSCALIQFP